jgi:hypothetical protein
MFHFVRQSPFFPTLPALLTAALLTLTYHSAGQQLAPWLGTWTLNLSKSKNATASPQYKRVTTHLESVSDGLKVTYEMVGIRGGVTRMEWTGRFDGKDYPMQGLDYVMTNAYRRIDDRSYEIVVKVDGSITSTARVTVSSDGKTLTVTTEGKTASGQIANTTAIYEKQ